MHNRNKKRELLTLQEKIKATFVLTTAFAILIVSTLAGHGTI